MAGSDVISPHEFVTMVERVGQLDESGMHAAYAKWKEMMSVA